MGGRCSVCKPPRLNSGQHMLQPGPFTYGTSPAGMPGSFCPRCHVTIGRMANATVPDGAVTIGPCVAETVTCPAFSRGGGEAAQGHVRAAPRQHGDRGVPLRS